MNARRRTVNFDLPARLIRRERGDHANYYYDQGSSAQPRYKPLGNDRLAALRKYADLEQGRAAEWVESTYTFRAAASKFLADIVPTKAAKTQAEYTRQMGSLLNFFEDAPLTDVMPLHISQYRESRRAAPSSANRELALFSTVWNHAREWGMTDRANPCAGIKRNKEKGRSDVYIPDHAFKSIWQASGPELRDFMDLAYLTGQRPGDILKASEHDIENGCLTFHQDKTGKKVPIRIEGELEILLKRIKARKHGMKLYTTRLIAQSPGKGVSLRSIQSAWLRACDAAGIEDFQARDIRAKTASDESNLQTAQSRAGHSTITTTEDYTRNRKGRSVAPLK